MGDMRREIEVFFHHDADANAAAIIFDLATRGRDLRTYPVSDDHGTVLATITFGATGKLVEIELLDASNQIPDNLR